MELMLVLHVIAIGVLWNWLPIRLTTVALVFAYFTTFYLVSGHYLASHRRLITPQIPLEDDYYRYRAPKKGSPFDPPETEVMEPEDEEATLELERKLRQEKATLQTQPKTKP